MSRRARSVKIIDVKILSVRVYKAGRVVVRYKDRRGKIYTERYRL